MLEAKNIVYKVGGRYLLNDVSLQLMPGKLNLLIGPNGAGKSTLIKVLSGALPPLQGEVLYEGKKIKEISVASLSTYRAVLAQSNELAFPMRVSETVMMGRYPHFTGRPTSNDERIVEEAMHFFEVIDLADRAYTSLSGGEKQRVHFARVASQIWETDAKQCAFLFLDEPLTFLDVFYQYDFMNKLKAFVAQRNILVLGVLHDLQLTGKYADEVVLMKEGKLIKQGDKESVLTKENIYMAYQLVPEIRINEGAVQLYF